MLKHLPEQVKQYLVVTGNYWTFTLTDGALRMLIVLHFHQLGYGALDIALLFVFYEFFGVVTNLVGGWLGARIGLNRTMQLGLLLQAIALLMLTVPSDLLSVGLVMCAQAISGVAKDLNKMSAKSSIKHLVPDDKQSRLYQWVALLTGSKNALKGAGFFLGALLLQLFQFSGAIWFMLAMIVIAALVSMFLLKADIGKSSFKPKFSDIFSKSTAINKLSFARMCLFGARDIWFVVALPVFLAAQLQWDNSFVGAFMALWVIAYGMVQAIAPKLTNRQERADNQRNASHLHAQSPTAMAYKWGGILTAVTFVLAFGLLFDLSFAAVEIFIVVGLLIFGFCFAINSSLHSYLIVSLAKSDGVSLDVGFYYMANALGRLIGTILSGYLYQEFGLAVCLWGSFIMLLVSTVVVKTLPESAR